MNPVDYGIMTPARPLLFAIQQVAARNGSEARTAIYFKGCALRCVWCLAPEVIEPCVEIFTDQEKCIGCRECLQSCPEEALSLAARRIERRVEACTACMACVESCPSLAQEALGWHADLDEILEAIKNDLAFYGRSGGVTFSGGEPLLQEAPLLELLRRCGELGVHRTVETTGAVPFETVLKVADHAERILYDVKHMDSDKHRRYTGMGNERILRNLKGLSRKEVDLRIRFPLVRGINDDEGNIRALGRFASQLPHLDGIDVLPYRQFSSEPCSRGGEGHRVDQHLTPHAADIARVRTLLAQYGHRVRIDD